MRITAGGVVVNNSKIALTSERNFWLIPKGKIERGETEEQAARREIMEEVGLTELKMIKKLGSIERLNPLTGEPKIIHCFLFTTTQNDLIPTEKKHIAKWFTFDEVIKTISLEKERKFIEEHKNEIISV